MKTLKAKMYKKMTANYRTPYLPYLNNLVEQYNNTYHHSINKKNPLMLIILLWVKKLRPILKLLSLKLMTELELLIIKILLVKATLKIGQEKLLLLIRFWKLIFGFIKLKI